MLYLFFKWLHIISIISWMAGILYLIRLFVNHREQGIDNPSKHDLLSGMEDRLYRVITVPAMGFSWFAGLTLIHLNSSFLHSHWLWGKLLCVLILTGLTFWCGRMRKSFAIYGNPALPGGRSLRILNEVPTLLMMLIVGLVIFKP